MASVAELSLVISGKDATSAAFQSVRQNVDGLDKAATSANTSTGGLGKGLVAAGIAGSAALGGLGVAVVGISTDINAANNTFQTQLGVSKDKAQELGDVAKSVFKDNFGGSVTDAAATISQAFQQFGDAGSGELKDISENALRLKDAFGVDTAQSIDAVKTLMQNFGLTSEQAFDMVTSGFQQGLNRSGDFLDTINEYSTQFKNGGASAGQFFSLLSSGLQGGVLGTDKAADAFKEFRVRIEDGSKTTATGLAQLGIDGAALAKGMADGSITAADAFDLVTTKLRDTSDENVKMQAGVALLGTQFEDLGTKAALSLSLTDGSFVQVEGSVKSLDAQYDNMGNRLETLKRKAELAIAPIGEKLQAVIPIASQVTDGLAGIASASAGFSAMVGVIGKLQPLLMAQKVATAAVTVAQWAWNVAMTANPIGIVVVAIAALVAGVILTIKYWDEITKKFPILETIVHNLRDAFIGLLGWVTTNWPLVAALILLPFAPIILIAGDAFGIRSKATEGFGAIIGWFGDNWTDAMWKAAMITPFGPVVAVASDAFGVRSKTEGALTGLIAFVKGVPSQLIAPFTDAPWGGMWDGLTSGTTTAVNIVIDALNAMISGMNKIQIHIPSIDTHLPGIGKVGGAGWDGPNISKIPRLADGGFIMQGGLAMVGERGPERVILPTGARVLPNGGAAGSGGNIIINMPNARLSERDKQRARTVAFSLAHALKAQQGMAVL